MSIIRVRVEKIYTKALRAKVFGGQFEKPLYLALTKQGTIEGGQVVRGDSTTRLTLQPVRPDDLLSVEVQEDVENGAKIAWAIDN